AGHRHHPHSVAVFFAEERHCTGGDRFLRRLDRRFNTNVHQNVVVDDLLDGQELLARERTEVHEVEAETIGCDERSRLFDVRTKHLTQSRMQEMRRRVIAANGGPAWRVDFRDDRCSDRNFATVHAYAVRAYSARDVLDVADARAEAKIVAERTDVGYLAAAL